MKIPSPSIVAVERAGARMERAGASRRVRDPDAPSEEVTCCTFSTGTPSARSSAPRRWTPGAWPPTTRGCRRRPDFPTAISMLMRLDPLVVRGLRHGPTQDYQQEYLRVNVALDDATATLVDVLRVHGHAAERVQATMDEDQRRQAVPAQDGGHARRGWGGSARPPCSSRRSSGRPSAWPPSSPTSSCRPVSRCARAPAAPAASASTPVPPAAAGTCTGGRAWRASSSSTPAPAATTCRSSPASRRRSAASASPPAPTRCSSDAAGLTGAPGPA